MKAQTVRVDDLMSGRPVWIAQEAEAQEASELAEKKGVHYLLVVDGENDLTAVTCRCDLIHARVGERVAHFAHSPVTYIVSGEPADRAAEMMRRCNVGFLPVLRDPGEVVGVVTRHDLGAAGLWNFEWGRTRCASCGSSHGLVHQDESAESVVFCKECLESTPEAGSWMRRFYCTLGCGD